MRPQYADIRFKNVSSSLKSLDSLRGVSVSDSCRLLPGRHSAAKAAAPMITAKSIVVAIKIVTFFIKFSSNLNFFED
jgi:hypothetical protein